MNETTNTNVTNNKKTNRKNKSNQQINWPSENNYFTFDTLIENNKHMLTDSGSSITLRSKLMKIVNEKNPQKVTVIGTKNTGHGRPKLVFSMCPVKAEVIQKAIKENVILSTPYSPENNMAQSSEVKI